MRTIFIPILLFLFTFTAYSQGSVVYDIEPKIENICSDYVSNWRKVGTINGYRIQIASYSGPNSRSQAENFKSSVSALFPYSKVYVSYSEPNFRVRFGDYFSRLEAYKDLVKVKETYPGAYIVPDKINYK